MNTCHSTTAVSEVKLTTRKLADVIGHSDEHPSPLHMLPTFYM